jgi:ribosomal protein S8
MASSNNSDKNEYSHRNYMIPNNVAYMPNGIREFLNETYSQQNQKDERLITWYNNSTYINETDIYSSQCLIIPFGKRNCILSPYQEHKDVYKIDTCIFCKINDEHINNWTASITPHINDNWKLNNNYLLQSKKFDELIEFFLEKGFIINYFYNKEKAFSVKLWQMYESGSYYIRMIFKVSEQDTQISNQTNNITSAIRNYNKITSAEPPKSFWARLNPFSKKKK